MSSNLKKISAFTLISPTSMSGSDLIYLVHIAGGISTSYALQFSDLFLGTNNLAIAKFVSDTFDITQGHVAINGSVAQTGNYTANGSITSVTPGSGSNGAIIIKDVSGNPGSAIMQFTNNAGTVEYNHIKSNLGGIEISSNVAIAGTNATLNGRQIDAFPTNTAMLFIQSSAPTGWTKITSYNDYALRIVSGTASVGGNVGFSSAFNGSSISAAIGATTLSIDQMPSHAHTIYDPTHFHQFPGDDQLSGWATIYGNINYSADSSIASGGHMYGTSSSPTGIGIYSTGGGLSHAHSATVDSSALNVKYIDAIICTKN